MVQFQGNIAGANIITYTPRGGAKYSPNDIEKHLKKFKLCDALTLIGNLSQKIVQDYQGLCFIENIPVSNGVLAYLSMRLIEKSNDYRSRNMTINDLLTAIDMFFGLPDPFQVDNENPQGCLIRMGNSQFDYDREKRNLLPRTLIIYRDLWNTVTNNNQVDVGTVIQSFCGLTLEEMLVLSLAFSGGADNGFFRIYEEIDS